MIELCGVSRSYGPTLAVDNLTLKVPAGEVFAFLGPNGAGKTTTIKILVGLLLPDAGSVHLGEYDVVRQRREACQLLGYVPDQPYLYDKLTGVEFLWFMARMYDMDDHEATCSIEQQIETFQLNAFVSRLAGSYSHGMKQRLVFAAAMVHRPAVLILDEPMVGLDPQSGRLIKDLLRAEAARGLTVFMSTHTLPVAEEIADRIGVLQHGQLRFIGTVDELHQQSEREHTSLESLFLDLTSRSTEPIADDR